MAKAFIGKRTKKYRIVTIDGKTIIIPLNKK